MKFYPASLSARITIGVLTLLVAGATMFLLIDNTQHRNIYLSERRADLGQDIETEALRLKQTIYTLRQDAWFLSNTPPVSGIMRARLNHGFDARDGDTLAKWEKRLQQIFSAFSKAHPDYYKIRYIGVADGGREMVRIDNRGEKIEITPPDKLQAKGGRDFFKATLGLREGQVSLSRFNLNQDWGVIEQPYRPTLRATVPVFTPSGELFGMVIINMAVDNLLKSAVSDIPGIRTYMANNDGQYLLHPDTQRAFKFELGSKDKISADFPFIETLFNPQAADYLPLQAAKPDGSWFAAKRIRFDLGDPSRFLLLMYYLPGDVAAKQIALTPAYTLFYEFILLLLTGGIAMLILRRTFSPLKQITQAADRIAASEQFTKLPQGGSGEIGSLTSALNAMLARLSQREQLLQKSETRLRTLYESTSDAVLLVGETGFLDCNKAALAMFGCATREEFCAWRPADISPLKQPDGMDSGMLIEQNNTMAIEKGSYHFEWICQRTDTGRTFPAEVLLNRMVLDGKTILQATVRDITERKLADEALYKAQSSLVAAQQLAKIGSWEWDVRNNTATWSDETYCLFEIDKSDLGEHRKNFLNLIATGDRIKVDQALNDALDGVKAYDIEYRVCLDSGKEKIIHALANVIRDAEGKAVAMQGTVQDITERKNNELKIERLSRIYLLLSRVNEAIVRAHDANELFTSACNAAVVSELFRFAWVGLLDEQRLAVVALACAGVEEGYLEKVKIRLDDERTSNAPTTRAILTGSPVIVQYIENDPGMAPWRDEALARGYRASAAFPIYEAGKAAGVINVYSEETNFFSPDIVQLMQELAADVSFALDVFSEKERRKLAEYEIIQFNVELEKRVEERTRQLESANKELEAFSYSVSHDLRAPLRSIDGFSRVLSKKHHHQLDATAQDWLDRICRASQHMGRLIDDMLKLSQVARSSLNLKLVDLSKIAEEVTDNLNKSNPERQVQFVLHKGLTVQADSGLLHIVMDNLLGNAYKFTSKKPNVEIEFGECCIDGERTFFVRDNGDGFNMAYADKLFGAFQRLHTANEFDGTGIGLATVQRVIHRHNGKVWAESKEAQGATFYFTLPQRECGGV